MKTVGIRELKDRLSEYLRHVRAGESLLVTDRGEVVAELGAPGQVGYQAVPPGLAALARAGQVTVGAPNSPDVYPSLPPALKSRRALDLLDEERGSR